MPTDATRPRPTPPPGRTAAPRPAPRQGLAHGTSNEKPLTGEQFVRLQALRLATERHRYGEPVTEEQLFATAERLRVYILTGRTTTEGH